MYLPAWKNNFLKPSLVHRYLLTLFEKIEMNYLAY